MGMDGKHTHHGDRGKTGLIGESQVLKTDERIEAIGAVDEAAAAIALARAIASSDVGVVLLKVQKDLSRLMTEISLAGGSTASFQPITTMDVAWLDETLKMFDANTEKTGRFFVAGETRLDAALDYARTVVRRAERRMAACYFKGCFQNEALLQYINRLSSLLFILELFACQHPAGMESHS